MGRSASLIYDCQIAYRPGCNKVPPTGVSVAVANRTSFVYTDCYHVGYYEQNETTVISLQRSQ